MGHVYDVDVDDAHAWLDAVNNVPQATMGRQGLYAIPVIGTGTPFFCHTQNPMSVPVPLPRPAPFFKFHAKFLRRRGYLVGEDCQQRGVSVGSSVEGSKARKQLQRWKRRQTASLVVLGASVKEATAVVCTDPGVLKSSDASNTSSRMAQGKMPDPASSSRQHGSPVIRAVGRSVGTTTKPFFLVDDDTYLGGIAIMVASIEAYQEARLESFKGKLACSHLTERATHAHPLHPAALASVPYGTVLVRVRVLQAKAPTAARGARPSRAAGRHLAAPGGASESAARRATVRLQLTAGCPGGGPLRQRGCSLCDAARRRGGA